MKRKITVLVLTTALACTMITGCGKKEENVVDTIVNDSNEESVNISVNEGDTTYNNTNNATDTTENMDNNSEVNVDTDTLEKEDTIVKLVGNWVDNNGNTLQLQGGNSFTAFFVENATTVYGTYETDWTSYLKLTYKERIPVENPTEEQVLLGRDYTEEEHIKEYKLTSIKSSSDTEPVQIKATLEGKEVIFTVYVDNTLTDIQLDTDSVIADDTEVTEVTDEAEIEALRQEMIDAGIDPDTGLPLEDVQRLIELGIDPLTGEPLNSENTEATPAQ